MTPHGAGREGVVELHSRSSVNAYLRAYHYLGGVTGWKVAAALVREEGLGWDGVVVVSRPVARLAPEGTLDVTRLCLRPGAPKNSGSRLLGWACRWAKANGYSRVVSYADPSVGHTGAIYRAANFRPDGETSAKSWGNRPGRKVRYSGRKLRFARDLAATCQGSGEGA